MRRFLAAALTAVLLASGCTPGDEADTPGGAESPASAAASPPADLPEATSELADLAAALTANDVSTVAMTTDPAAAQEDLTTIFSGMDGHYPTFEAGELAYEGEQAVGTLTVSFAMGEDDWSYATPATFTLQDGEWLLEWAPSVVHPELTEQTRLRFAQEEARRGPINDNTGLALVEERALYEVGLDKARIDEGQWATVAAQLAGLLEMDAEAYTAKVLGAGPRAFVIAKTLPQVEIPAGVADVPGRHVREIRAVLGPSSTFAASILGTVGEPTAEMIEASEGKLSVNDRVGRSGLQSRYDEQLRGVPMMRVDLVSRAAPEGASPSPTPMEPRTLFQQDESVSEGIDLSLDRDLQTKAEEVLSTQEGLATLVVINLADGGVLAAAQSPTGGTYPHATFGKFAPGSTFKVVSALAMMRHGVGPSSTVQCPATLPVDTYTFGNYTGYGHTGAITLTDAFKYSCNTAFVAGAEQVTSEQLAAAAGSLGVGTDYDAGFTSNFGTVAPGSRIDRAASMIGQGQVTMSPLGMASVAASVGSGRTVIPWLVKGHEAKPTAAPLTAAEAQGLQAMMKATVDTGTAQSLKGTMIGAKTGTAQWGPAGQQQTHAWMIAYNDTVAVSAFVEVGDSGGTTAAPLITALFS
ncbi:penicillin-binding transpeptidase domain-containing protein [Tessaracoccus massiliensis]|uniref:penicillin-binding transpeptidase domain-containing protein n=1 Tax=Tessaracoccus massiliensis TaxID=1522311 RepID=UPI00058B1B46|nr:penicillin-binding transpeptidase domain-containing protein [Tessaracoccus massiliensis]